MNVRIQVLIPVMSTHIVKMLPELIFVTASRDSLVTEKSVKVR